MTAVVRGVSLIRLMPVVFVLIWSTGFIVARYGMPYAPPISFLTVRYVLSILCFLPWVVLAKVAWPVGRRQWAHLAVTGCLMHAGYLGGVWAAVKAPKVKRKNGAPKKEKQKQKIGKSVV